MDYSRVSLTDAAGRLLVSYKGDLAGEMDRIGSALDKILADPSKTRAEKHVATLQHQAAQDALSWAFDHLDRYFTPVGGDGS